MPFRIRKKKKTNPTLNRPTRAQLSQTLAPSRARAPGKSQPLPPPILPLSLYSLSLPLSSLPRRSLSPQPPRPTTPSAQAGRAPCKFDRAPRPSHLADRPSAPAHAAPAPAWRGRVLGSHSAQRRARPCPDAPQPRPTRRRAMHSRASPTVIRRPLITRRKWTMNSSVTPSPISLHYEQKTDAIIGQWRPSAPPWPPWRPFPSPLPLSIKGTTELSPILPTRVLSHSSHTLARRSSPEFAGVRHHRSPWSSPELRHPSSIVKPLLFSIRPKTVDPSPSHART
jgi:hypothetical protein